MPAYLGLDNNEKDIVFCLAADEELFKSIIGSNQLARSLRAPNINYEQVLQFVQNRVPSDPTLKINNDSQSYTIRTSNPIYQLKLDEICCEISRRVRTG